MAMFRRLGLAVFVAAMVVPGWMTAQTQADFFDPTVLHRFDITINPSDWSRLKIYYLDNTYYPMEFTWKGLTVECGMRSRGTGSRSGIKPGLKVDINRY